VLCEEAIYRSIDRVMERWSKEQDDDKRWAEHIQAMGCPYGVEKLIMRGVVFLVSCADGYYKTYGAYISADEKSAEMWANTWCLVQALLSGDTGRLDGKTLEDLLVDMAASQGFKLGSPAGKFN